MNRIITRTEAIDITEELWRHLAKTGRGIREKVRWEGWKRHGIPDSTCALCALGDCITCPYSQHSNHMCMASTSPYTKWCNAKSANSRKYWAWKIVHIVEAIRKAGGLTWQSH